MVSDNPPWEYMRELSDIARGIHRPAVETKQADSQIKDRWPSSAAIEEGRPRTCPVGRRRRGGLGGRAGRPGRRRRAARTRTWWK